jgi:aminopeptidase-like protein
MSHAFIQRDSWGFCQTQQYRKEMMSKRKSVTVGAKKVPDRQGPRGKANNI